MSILKVEGVENAEFKNLDVVESFHLKKVAQIVGDAFEEKGFIKYNVKTQAGYEDVWREDSPLKLYGGPLHYTLYISGEVPNILKDYLIENNGYKVVLSDGLIMIGCTQELFKSLYKEYLKDETYFKIIDTQIDL